MSNLDLELLVTIIASAYIITLTLVSALSIYWAFSLSRSLGSVAHELQTHEGAIHTLRDLTAQTINDIETLGFLGSKVDPKTLPKKPSKTARKSTKIVRKKTTKNTAKRPRSRTPKKNANSAA